MVYHYKSSTKNMDFNHFIDTKTLFDDIKFKTQRFEDAEENRMEFKSKLSSVRIGGNELNKKLNEIENITNFYKS